MQRQIQNHKLNINTHILKTTTFRINIIIFWARMHVNMLTLLGTQIDVFRQTIVVSIVHQEYM